MALLRVHGSQMEKFVKVFALKSFILHIHGKAGEREAKLVEGERNLKNQPGLNPGPADM